MIVSTFPEQDIPVFFLSLFLLRGPTVTCCSSWALKVFSWLEYVMHLQSKNTNEQQRETVIQKGKI